MPNIIFITLIISAIILYDLSFSEGASTILIMKFPFIEYLAKKFELNFDVLLIVRLYPNIIKKQDIRTPKTHLNLY